VNEQKAYVAWTTPSLLNPAAKMETVSARNKFRKLNVADWISVYRIVTAPVLVAVVLLDLRFVFLVLLALSLFSDMLDGIVARRRNIRTLRGARLDSVGDAVTFAVAIFGVIYFEYAFFMNQLGIILCAVIPYVAQILLAVILFGKPTSYHTYLAKAAALFQGCFILLLLLGFPLLWLLYTTVVITVLEITEEFILMFRIGGNATNVKGVCWLVKERKRDQ
jgi:phosphatidylglycerophosphate synthase